METNAVVLKIDFCFVNEFRSSISSSINLIFIICLVRFAFVIGDWCFVCLCIFEGLKELCCGAVLCTKKASNFENQKLSMHAVTLIHMQLGLYSTEIEMKTQHALNRHTNIPSCYHLIRIHFL